MGSLSVYIDIRCKINQKLAYKAGVQKRICYVANAPAGVGGKQLDSDTSKNAYKRIPNENN